jgi:hypothetical protein
MRKYEKYKKVFTREINQETTKEYVGVCSIAW